MVHLSRSFYGLRGVTYLFKLETDANPLFDDGPKRSPRQLHNHSLANYSSNMKVLGLALLALVFETEYVAAFVPSGFQVGNGARNAVSVEMSTESNVSIPYDAAARLAYDQWRDEYLKGEFDPVRYESFKANYEAIAVLNVSSKKKARDEGNSPSILNLNEYADCTAEEYEALMKGEEPEAPPTSGNILEQVMEAAQSQMAASSALQEAADALAEEEKVGLRTCCVT